MITVHRAEQRRLTRQRTGTGQSWLSFGGGDQGPLGSGFGALVRLDEHHIPPGRGLRLGREREFELVTYVLDGAIAHEESGGRSEVIRSGEFQRISRLRGVRHNNASQAHAAVILQIGLRSPAVDDTQPATQRRFTAAERRGRLRIIASPDGRLGSLRLAQDAILLSAIVEAGQHLVHALGAQRDAWIQIVSGQVGLDESVLSAGDGAALTTERAVSLTAIEQGEVLLLELPC